MKSKLNGGNVIKGINTWAVSILRYSAAFIDWNKEELKEFDRKTRKYIYIYIFFLIKEVLFNTRSLVTKYMYKKVLGSVPLSYKKFVFLN